MELNSSWNKVRVRSLIEFEFELETSSSLGSEFEFELENLILESFRVDSSLGMSFRVRVEFSQTRA